MIMGSTQNIGEGKGPNVGPRGKNIHYLNAPKPNDPHCSPTPCYIRCQINKPGGCISDIGLDPVFNKFTEVMKVEKD
jgi:hypothetical protein